MELDSETGFEGGRSLYPEVEDDYEMLEEFLARQNVTSFRGLK